MGRLGNFLSEWRARRQPAIRASAVKGALYDRIGAVTDLALHRRRRRPRVRKTYRKVKKGRRLSVARPRLPGQQVGDRLETAADLAAVALRDGIVDMRARIGGFAADVRERILGIDPTA